MSHDPDAVHLPSMPLPPILPAEGDDRVWVVAQVKPPAWELGGIYSSKAAALAACTEPTDCLMEVPLDTDLGRATEIHGEYPAARPVCSRCRGRGVVPDFSNWDAYHGEPKPKPCPDCSPG